MKLYTKKVWRRALSLTICLMVAMPLLAAPVSVSALTDDSYTEVDYSNQLTLDAPATGSTSGAGEFLDTEHWWFYLDAGYTINLTAGESYIFSYTVTAKDQETGGLEPAIAILTGGEFAGYGDDYDGDCLSHAEDYFGDSTAIITAIFVPETTGNYRVLTGCALYDELEQIGVDTELSVSKSNLTLKWESELAGEDVGEDMNIFAYYTTSAPDGTVYTITDTDLSEDSGHPNLYLGAYTLYAFSPDGENLWNYDLTLPSLTQPLVGADGTIYAATISGVSDESEIDPQSNDEYGSSRIVALNPDGSEKWVKEYEAELVDEDRWLSYNFVGQMALSKSGVLVLNSCENMIVAVDVNNSGEILWEIGDDGNTLYFPFYNTWSSPAIYEDTVYIPVYYNNENYYYGVAAYQLSDGQELWHVAVDDCCGPADSNISVDRDGTIYLVGDGYVEIGEEELNSPIYAIGSDGVVKWVKDVGMNDDNSYHTATDDNYLYVGSGASVYVLDKSSGELVRQIDGLGSWLVSLTVLSDGSMGVASFDSYEEEDNIVVFFIVSADGKITEWFPFPISNDGNYENIPLATVTKDGYYIISINDNIYCIDIGMTLASGWALNAGNSAYTNSLASNSLTFVSNGGSEVAQQTVWTGDSAVKPADPTRANETISETTTRVFTFDKWYTDEACTEPYDFSAAVMGDITLYAGWTHVDNVQDTSKPDTSEPDTSKPDTAPPPTGESGALILWLVFGTASLAAFSGMMITRRRTGK